MSLRQEETNVENTGIPHSPKSKFVRMQNSTFPSSIFLSNTKQKKPFVLLNSLFSIQQKDAARKSAVLYTLFLKNEGQLNGKNFRAMFLR